MGEDTRVAELEFEIVRLDSEVRTLRARVKELELLNVIADRAVESVRDAVPQLQKMLDDLSGDHELLCDLIRRAFVIDDRLAFNPGSAVRWHDHEYKGLDDKVRNIVGAPPRKAP
jgi:predicted nuclease with TOPRIM domain